MTAILETLHFLSAINFRNMFSFRNVTLGNRTALSLKWIFSQNQWNYHFLHGSQIEAFWYANMVHIPEKSLSLNWLFFVTNLKALFVDLNYDLLTTKLFQISNKQQDLCYNINEIRIVCVCRPKYKMVMPFIKSFFDSNSNYIISGRCCFIFRQIYCVVWNHFRSLNKPQRQGYRHQNKKLNEQNNSCARAI